ncbi:MAG: tetratricopeptide repeat protein, partial [Parafilimonas sp.]
MIPVINTAIKLPLCVAAKGEICPEILFRKFQLHPAMRYLFILITLLLSSNLFSQEANTYIFKGNEAYKKGDYETATKQYKEALRKDPTNNIARFNYANALQKQNEAEKSEKEYDGIIASSKNTSINAHSFYNKGLAQLKQNKLSDAVHAFKQALKLNSEDNDTRDNLQLAINQLKKQQQ